MSAIGYLTHHNLRYPAKALLQASVDTYMKTFAEEETARLRAMAKRRQEPDEDGFITVVRGGRVAPARQEEAKATLEKKKEKGSHEGFYRFQAREDRKKRQLQLLAKFEEDKKRVAARKSQRKFKVRLHPLASQEVSNHVRLSHCEEFVAASLGLLRGRCFRICTEKFPNATHSMNRTMQ